MNAATASSSGGAAGSPAARSRSASRRRATEGAVAGSFIPATTAAASSWSASSEWRESSDDDARSRTSTASAKRWARLSACASTMRCVGGCRGVRRGVHGLLQVLGPVGEPGARLGHSEVEQQCRLVARRRRLGERSAQEDGLRLGSALLPRRARGLDQPLDDPAVAGGLADQQVLGDALVRARLLGEQPGGTAVASRALCAGELRVDPAADDRVDERQRPAGLEDPRGRQQVGGVGCLGLVEARESRRLEKVALLEDRQRPSEPPGMLRQPTEPEANRATDRSCTDSLDVARGLRGRSDASFAQRLHEHAHQERRPARCAQAGIDEDRIRSPAEPRLDELGDGCARQRRKTDHIGGGIGRHGRKQLGIGACLARAGRHDERGVQLFEAREQEGQVAQGRGVCPVRVVDDQAERTRGGQVRAQPVEAVEDRERGIDARRGRAVRGGCARKPEQAGRHAGSGLQQIGALELRCLGQRRLEQLTHHSEGEIALQLGPPRAKHAHSARLPPPSAPPRAAPSCRSRPALRSPRTCRAPREPRPAPTRSAPAPRSARAAVRWPRTPFICLEPTPMRGRSRVANARGDDRKGQGGRHGATSPAVSTMADTWQPGVARRRALEPLANRPTHHLTLADPAEMKPGSDAGPFLEDFK